MQKIASTITTTILISLTTAAFANNIEYSIIVDAGSSGSRLHLFQYDKDKAIPEIKDLFSENTKPGLSSFANNPEAAGESLKKLLDDAVTTLKNQHIDPHSVSISILATAGMRLLPSDTQTAIYTNVSHYIKSNYTFSVDQVETIPGKMESLYGWLEVNYLARTFQDNLHSVGSIDMGGASTQIAFATENTSRPKDEVSVKIGQTTYTVFAKSFLGLGLDQALAAMSQDIAAASCYPLNYPGTIHIGDFNSATCGSIYAKLIQQQRVAEELAPVAGQKFIAYSGAYYTYHFFGVDKTPYQSLVEQRVHSICSKTWDQLQQDYPKEALKYLANYCANEIYLTQLFYGTYQLQDQQLTVTTQINQQDIDWTLGALLFKLSKP